MGRYRRRLEIIADVLGVVSDGARKTQIMYQANLSYRLLTRYLQDVLDLGLVRLAEEHTYALTEKGAGFLEAFKEYHARRLKVEERLDKVDAEKLLLEDKFLNATGTDAALPNCAKKKRAAEERE